MNYLVAKIFSYRSACFLELSVFTHCCRMLIILVLVLVQYVQSKFFNVACVGVFACGEVLPCDAFRIKHALRASKSVRPWCNVQPAKKLLVVYLRSVYCIDKN